MLERRHGLTLLCHRIFLIPGPCRTHVRSFLVSTAILHIHRMQIQVPDFNAADDAAVSLAPTTGMDAFGNLPTQVDFTYHQVSSQCVGMSIWTYPAVPQNILDSSSMPDPCTFLSCIYHDPSYSSDANPKSPTSMPQMLGRFRFTPLQRWGVYLIICQHRQILQLK